MSTQPKGVESDRERPHLSKDYNTSGRKFGINKESEFYCRLCGSRVTVTTSGMEAGHRKGCPQRPDHLPKPGNSLPEGYLDCKCPTCGKDYSSPRGAAQHHYHAHGESVVKPTACPTCEEIFKPKSRNETYCCRACADIGNRNRVTLECEHCGDAFEVKESKSDNRRTCSRECKAELLKRDPQDCDHCGETFQPSRSGQRFCSRKCGAQVNRNRIERTCEYCEDSFETTPSEDRTYCSPECGYKDRRKDDVELTCEHCGDAFEAKPKDADSRRYCSQECYLDSVKLDERECEQCEESFQPTHSGVKFCSKKCEGLSRRNRVVLTCERCGDDYERPQCEADRSTYCSNDCRYDR